jgi:hypothetical protein
VADVTQENPLRPGGENAVLGDADYQSLCKRLENSDTVLTGIRQFRRACARSS